MTDVNTDIGFDPDSVIGSLLEETRAPEPHADDVATVWHVVRLLQDDQFVVMVKAMTGSSTDEFDAWDSSLNFGHAVLSTRKNHFSLYYRKAEPLSLFLRNREKDMCEIQADFEAGRLKLKVIRTTSEQVVLLNNAIESAARRIAEAANLKPMGGIFAECRYGVVVATEVGAIVAKGTVIATGVAGIVGLMSLAVVSRMNPRIVARNSWRCVRGVMSSMDEFRDNVIRPARSYARPEPGHTNCAMFMAEVCREAGMMHIRGNTPGTCFAQFDNAILDHRDLKQYTFGTLKKVMVAPDECA